MIKNTTSKLFLMIVVIWGLHSCAVDDMTIEKTPIKFPDPLEIIATSITGSLEDEGGQPVTQALVTCSNCVIAQTTLSDEKGDFQFLDVEIKGESGFITVESAGKYDAFRRIGLLEGRNNYTRILMKDQVALGRLQANQGGQLNHTSGASIALPANGIVDDNGLTHAGDYEIFMSCIDPSAEDLNLRMVGDLSAIAADGEVVGLSTYGMLQVELEAPDGTALNLKEGTTATLEFPVPASLKATAPSVIPLWSYDEENGYWIEEGQAFLEDDKYVGEVTHFSTWNVDVKIDPVDICGSISVVNNGQEVELPYFQVKLSGDAFQSIGGWLCEDGTFRYLNVPSGETFLLEVFNYCGEFIGAIELGPYETGKVELDPIIIADETEITFIEISGNAVNCEGIAISNGCVSINLAFDSYIFTLEPDGSFTTSFPTCGAFEASIQVLDKDGFSLSLPIVLTEASTVLSLDNIEVCGEEPEEYIYFTYHDSTSNVLKERYYFNENELGYRRESTMPGDTRYNLSNVPNGSVMYDGIGLTVIMTPEIGVPQLCSALIIFKENGGTFEVINDVEIEFTELGSLNSLGELEFLEGHFNYRNGAVQGGFRLKFE